jgi:hypothetical protein
MTDTNPQQADRRNRYAAAIRETDGWVLDDRQHMIDAVIAVADAEQAEMRERHHAGLRRADEINNGLMQEVQRYAAGTEQPVLWSVYNRMHTRALNAEAEVKRLADGRAVVDRKVVEQVREIVRRLANHAVGFGDVLDESDRGPWGAMVGADIAALQAAVTAASAPVSPAPADRAAILREAADEAERVAESLRAHHEFERSTGALDVMTELRRLADAASGPGDVAGETQQPERPRCPHCRMPHDLTPDVAAVCASIRASIAEDEARQPKTQADFQDRGDAARRAAGIDGTAGDAQDVPHAFVLDEPTGGCLLCGLSPTYRKHQPAVVSQPDEEA